MIFKCNNSLFRVFRVFRGSFLLRIFGNHETPKKPRNRSRILAGLIISTLLASNVSSFGIGVLPLVPNPRSLPRLVGVLTPVADVPASQRRRVPASQNPLVPPSQQKLDPSEKSWKAA